MLCAARRPASAFASRRGGLAAGLVVAVGLGLEEEEEEEDGRREESREEMEEDAFGAAARAGGAAPEVLPERGADAEPASSGRDACGVRGGGVAARTRGNVSARSCTLSVSPIQRRR